MEEYVRRVEKEYLKIDMTTGERLDVALFDPRLDEIPEDYKEAWDSFTPFYNPKWDFEQNKWVESLTLDQILAPMKQAKIQKLSDECQTVIMFGFMHNGDLFQFNDKDQANFNQQLSLMILDPTIQSVLWKTENNGVKNFSREDFIEACKAGERHKRNSIGQYWQLKEYVLNTSFSSKEELEAVNFGFTIPTSVGV